ncbi:mucin TcMUCII [Trypanosoma cruzi]|nr:mucin TcMUCII [Trypanosoma cruzi]
MPGALQPDGGETGGPQTESGRDSEEGLRSPGPSLPKEAGTAITGQTRAPPESLNSASDNPEPAGLATQSPHTRGATGMSDAQNKGRSKIHEAMSIIRHQLRLRPLRQRHRRPPLRQRHQVLRAQRRQPPRLPAHRHAFVKSTAASAALRGCVPRCCSPYPRWCTPLWTEDVYANRAFQHSTAGICARILWSDVYYNRK